MAVFEFILSFIFTYIEPTQILSVYVTAITHNYIGYVQFINYPNCITA